MGNIASIAGGPQEVVRVVRDGKVLEFDNDMAVEELLSVYPKSVVCQDQVQENGKMRRRMLAPKDVLRRGQVYLLFRIPTQQQQQQKQQAPSTLQQQQAQMQQRAIPHKAPKVHPVNVPTTAPAPVPSRQQQQLHNNANGATKLGPVMKSTISKQQIAKILQEGSVKITTKNGVARLSGAQLTRLLNQASGRSSPSPKKQSPWLESIPEEPMKPIVSEQQKSSTTAMELVKPLAM
ncbi:hypothetical protein MPTK1_8g10000 [Marchantia polymorpha subsp. ruderalis]|uniref:Uncharacterized protein n=1 Tax=Marchantia polymorpha TaxID=3197 RepID=A0A2R6XN69_MARPO|nr:hypothetical protein MARPO_0008s0222 [Marchantia polymorpha]BBN19357.1 hypothetical protein Mp_8g10000 [Marchantia polymorpha subsp. ruderalis]|eukprot:PTQ47476.1 hypothetical protein MARPO_0008s0222 [Marchantia polymorpha]